MFKFVISHIAKSKLLLVLLCRLYLSGFNVLFSYLTQQGLSVIQEGNSLQLLIEVAFVMIGGAFVYIGLYYIYSSYLAGIFQQSNRLVAQRLIQAFLNQTNEMGQTSEGEIVNLIHNDVSTVSSFLSNGLLPLLDTGLSLLLGIYYVVSMHMALGVFFILGGLVIGVGNYLLTTKMESSYGEYMVASDQHYNFYEQLFRIFPIVKIYSIVEWLYQKHSDHFKQRSRSFEQYNGYYANSLSLTEGGVITFEILSLAFGLYFVVTARLNVAVLLGIWNAGLGSIIYPLSALPSLWNYFIQYRTSARRVSEKWEESGYGDDEQMIATHTEGKNTIQFENVSFAYAHHPVFNKLNLTLKPEGICFLVGPSGSGKSTLLKLILGNIRPQEGKVSFIGADSMVQKDAGARPIMGYVPQKVKFFNTSLRSNLLMGKKQDDAVIQEVCSALNVWEVIAHLPEGLDTLYGEDIQLSNGQMRRLGVARAILSGAYWILLDEPFSDLDYDNQKFLMNTVRTLKDHAFMIVTHTMEMIQDKDEVIEVEKI